MCGTEREADGPEAQHASAGAEQEEFWRQLFASYDAARLVHELAPGGSLSQVCACVCVCAGVCACVYVSQTVCT